MRLGIYGGTFNPIHNGHIHILSGAKTQLALDRLLLIPTCVPPHKQVAGLLAGDDDRLAMCRLAAEPYPWIYVDDREIRRGGLSYTSDTLRELKRDYPDAELFLLMGSDMLLTIAHWHESSAIAEMCTVVGFLRPPDTLDRLNACASGLRQNGWRVRLLDVPPLRASSTEIRAGDCTQLPAAVRAYLHEHHLYQQEANP